MDQLLLKILMLFRPLLAKSGANTDQLFQIIKLKLIIDRRRPKSTFAKKKTEGNAKVGNPWIVDLGSLFIGALMGLLLFFGKSPLAAQSFYFTMFMVLVAFTLISDFSTVLFDVRDQYILLPRPVDDRTLTLSRIFHITIYVMRLSLLMGLPGMVIAGFVDSSVISPVIFLVQLFLATFLCILIVNLIYLVMARSVSPQKFKDIITYFQISFSILIFAVYYLLPRLINLSVLENINLVNLWWAYLLPPVWIAAINEAILHAGRLSIAVSLLAALGFFLPPLGLWFVAKVLAPGFNRRLVVLATSDGHSASVTEKRTYKTDFRDKLANFFCADSLENAGFRVTWKLAARTREFKMRTFPSFAYVPFYFVYIVLQGKGSLADKFDHMRSNGSYIFLIYLSTIILTQLLSNISQSEKYKSSWVYFAMPISEPGKILSGMFKALLWLYFIPYTLIISLIAIVIWGPFIINDVILATLISTIYGVLMALFTVKGMPFSQPVLNKQSGGKWIRSILSLLLVSALGLGHYFLRKFEIVVWVCIIPIGLATWAMLHFYRKQTWESVELSEV